MQMLVYVVLFPSSSHSRPEFLREIHEISISLKSCNSDAMSCSQMKKDWEEK